MKNLQQSAIIFNLVLIFLFTLKMNVTFAQYNEDSLKLCVLQNVAGTWDNGKGTKVHVYFVDDRGGGGIQVWADMEKLIYTSKNGCVLEPYSEKNMVAAIDLFTTDATSIHEGQMYCGKDKNNKHFYKKVWWIQSGNSKIKQPMVSFFSKKDGYIHFNYHEGYLQTSGHYEYPVPMKRITKEWSINNNNNQNNNVNNEIVISESQFIINLYNQSNSTVFTSPGENSTCKLQADVDCSNPKDKKDRKIKLEFVGDAFGSFNTSESVTDANGKAYFSYTAPDENALKGKDHINIEVKAVDVATGKFSVVAITVWNRSSNVNFSVKNTIMPQGKNFFNEITLSINAPPKSGGYKIKIESKEQFGIITADKNNDKGFNFIVDNVKSGKEYKLYYSHIGSATLLNPIEEEITIEVPELNFKQKINISVGMDLSVTGITRKSKGAIYPGLAEPLEVHLTDNFHPGADLERIFNTYQLKPKLKLTLIDYDQNNKLYYSDDDLCSKVLSYAEGYFFGPSIATPTAEFYFSTAKKTGDNTYLLVDKLSVESKSPDIYPAVYFFDRGNFVFKAELYDFEYNDNTINNSNTISLTVDEYRDKTDRLLKKVYIPCAKYMIGFWGLAKEGTWEGMKFVGKVISGVDMVGQWSKIEHIKESIQNGDLKEALTGTYGFFMNFIDESKYGKTVKLLLHYNTLAMTVKDLVGGIIATKNNEGGGQTSCVNDISDKLIYPQLLVKGTNKHFVLVLDKTGIKNYTAKLKDGNKLLPTPKKLKDGKEIIERIEESDEYIYIPAELTEEINLNLDFNGTAGYLYRVTKDKIEKIEYPKTSSGKIAISSSNVLTFGKQEKEKEKPKEKEKEKKTNLFSGSWETTDFGTVSFVITGSDIVATCTKNLAGMKGKLSSDGTKITGSWAKFPTYSSPNDAGLFSITVSADGKSFTGKWGNGTDSKAKLDKNLNGKKK